MANRESGEDEYRWGDQNRDVVTEGDVEKIMEDKDDDVALDVNDRPGLLSGEPFIPPVALTGPNVSGTSMGMGDTGAGAMGGLPPAVVPVVNRESESGVDTGVLVNPFTPADPDNERPFDADAGSPAGLASRVEAELAADGRIPAAGLSIVNDDGVIVLDGTAPSEEVARDIESTVLRIPGVLGVRNNLKAAG